MAIKEQNIVSALRVKHPEALEYLMTQYGQSVFSLVRTILRTGTTEDVEDCVSEVFAAAWEKGKEYDAQKGTIKTWLLMLTKYMALNYRRKLSKQSTYQLKDHHIVTSLQSVERDVLQKERLRAVLAVVDTFSKLDQQLFYRRYFLQESLDELVQSFALTKRAIENRLWRCRQAIKDNLSEKEASSCGV